MERHLSESVWRRLQADGLRRTPQREAVLEALDAADEALPLPVILARARRRAPGLGERTVERTLALLVARDAVDAIPRGGGEVAYRLCVTRAHHHHLVCVRCGAVAELPECAVGDWARQEADRHGYAVEGHELTVWGTCPRCRARRGRRAAIATGPASGGPPGG